MCVGGGLVFNLLRLELPHPHPNPIGIIPDNNNSLARVIGRLTYFVFGALYIRFSFCKILRITIYKKEASRRSWPCF